ncbi:GAF domain-containing sensor histidine kinase [Brevirhabdus sp.]|uniref:GAF domain-containing sensor histidine kinase n=1 Tax=Brevirhabdus sp. TaxID=2004514 RepID=UPI00405897D8
MVSPEIARDVEQIKALDTVPSILQVLSDVTGMRFAVIARVTDTNWTACAVRDTLDFGMVSGDELEIDKTFCDRVVRSHTPVAFDHATQDPIYSHDPIPKLYGIESYISVPIVRADGSNFGTLCALDSDPKHVVTDRNMKLFELFAQLIGQQLVTQDDLDEARSRLAQEREVSVLREQFVAVLGHDLRNPLAAINAGLGLLRRRVSGAEEVRLLDLIEASSQRMENLVRDTLDFARGRMGGGIAIRAEPATDLAQVLEQTVAELRQAHPDRQIVTKMRVDGPVVCDTARIAQLSSNLLSNALQHGDADGPVEVSATANATVFELRVLNNGDGLPADMLEGNFTPFRRFDGTVRREGLGLGLYIASEIAKSHAGMLCAEARDGTVRFTFTMPRTRRP